MSTSRHRQGYNGENSTHTSKAVDSALKEGVLALYTRPLALGDIHFPFENGPLRIHELLQIIITSSTRLVWPIDKEELATVWSKLFLIPRGAEPDGFFTKMQVNG